MDSADIVLVIVVATALAFDFTNGFHDTANAIATSVSTRAMSPRTAVALSAVLNFAGAFISLKVAATVASGIVDAGAIDHDRRLRRARRRDRLEPRDVVARPAVELVARAHRRRGRRRVRRRRGGGVIGGGLVDKVLVPGIVAPILAFAVAALAIVVVYRIVGELRPGSGQPRLPPRADRVTGSMFSLAHGTNDAQKTMGIITLALIAHGDLPAHSVRRAVLGDRLVGGGDRAGHVHRRLADHPHDGHPHHQDGPGAGLLRAGGGRRGRCSPPRTSASRCRRPTSSPARSWAPARRSGCRPSGGASRATSRSPGSSRCPPRRRSAAHRLRVQRRVRRRGRPGRRVGGAARRDRGDLRPAPVAGPAGGGRGMIATIDVGKLAELVWASLLAGIAVAVCFSLVIIGVARAGDCRRTVAPARRPRTSRSRRSRPCCSSVSSSSASA